MNEKQTNRISIRPTKKQRELLTFISNFIAEHGYSPSYREIMAGLSYTSVATVALHVNSLIRRGHLQKRDHAARSLELTKPDETKSVTTNQVAPSEEKWLVARVEHAIAQLESSGAFVDDTNLRDLCTLVGALKVLGMEAAVQGFQPRLRILQTQNARHRSLPSI